MSQRVIDSMPRGALFTELWSVFPVKAAQRRLTQTQPPSSTSTQPPPTPLDSPPPPYPIQPGPNLRRPIHLTFSFMLLTMKSPALRIMSSIRLFLKASICRRSRENCNSNQATQPVSGHPPATPPPFPRFLIQ